MQNTETLEIYAPIMGPLHNFRPGTLLRHRT